MLRHTHDSQRTHCMTERQSFNTLGLKAETNLFFGPLAVLLIFVGSSIVSYINTRTLESTANQMAQTHEVLLALEDILSLIKDAETGQRGYVITGENRYLEPYSAAIVRLDSRLDELDQLTRGSPEQQKHITPLRSALEAKLKELDQTIELRRDSGFETARSIVLTDRGKAAMDAIRSHINDMRDAEKIRRLHRIASMQTAYRIAVGSGILTGVIGVALSVILGFLLRRAALLRRRQDWLQTGQLGLSRVMVGDKRIDRLSDNILRYLAEYLNAQAAAFYTRDGASYRRVATYGVPADDGTVAQFEPHDGLLGRAVVDGKSFLLEDVPDGYLTIGSAMGRSRPRHLLIVPVVADETVNGVIEIGFLNDINKPVLDLFERSKESIGIAVRSSNDRVQLQNLLEESQRQGEELQAQGEELRVSNEELEEQSRILKESQSRLELQQAELEQTNAQLEEQTQLLEAQRDDINRSKSALESQAVELQQASQYKSEFLANMSHELRTPLNSSLILAKLLADNPDSNLTAEQVRYAETIQSAGNDLLTLINDILDLSKIEAGQMEMHPEWFRVSQIIDDLNRTFKPVADQKPLTLRMQVQPGAPEMLSTDRMRLEQVLKNLLSNAMKFTEQGEVALTVSSAHNGQVSFAVTDTGIGIPESQQQIIFEAFRQADGTTNRKYGGTGLGLSISRELTRRLGGQIHLASEPDKGSTFTITIPQTYDPSRVPPREKGILQSAFEPRPIMAPVPTLEIPSTKISAIANPPAGKSTWTQRIEDDRARLTGNRRIILVVEDDLNFARILFDLAHESGFQCLIATTSEEGLAVAAQYLPSAVILDIGLPDHSGLSVLDRLKHDARTRHIPVHVVSGSDYVQTAMSLGAVGYMLKPVKREDLSDALQRLETRLAQRMRRVLVVEDDPVQLDSLRKLIGTHDVETVGAQSAAECLECLKTATFDCMVLDLSLPDASGYSLLETLSREDTYSFPPVIVYTGRELSVDEEQQLRRYSKSIIIKGAKSPERLLDEVTLFLHQVVSDLPAEQQRMLEKAKSRDAAIEGRRILIVEDDVRNVFALTSILEPRGAALTIARNGREAIDALTDRQPSSNQDIDLVLMDVMMPEMDGITATREIRKNPEWKKIPIIMLTAKAMNDDQDRCLAAGANDYMAKPVDVEKLLSLVRVWMPR